MKKLVYVFLSIFAVFALTACSSQKQQPKDSVPKMLEVNLTVSPAKGEVNQQVTFKAEVTQGSEKVNDADEVTFEIWRSKDPNHEKITIKNPKNGVYSLKKTFQQEGTYYIISHVTARGMHNMPKKEFVIGQPSEKEDSQSNSSMGDMKM